MRLRRWSDETPFALDASAPHAPQRRGARFLKHPKRVSARPGRRLPTRCREWPSAGRVCGIGHRYQYGPRSTVGPQSGRLGRRSATVYAPALPISAGLIARGEVSS